LVGGVFSFFFFFSVS